jgi:hypothetical protein
LRPLRGGRIFDLFNQPSEFWVSEGLSETIRDSFRVSLLLSSISLRRLGHD